ncbi:copper resistance CopC/CopD family protein [Mesorhizobium sp. L-8-3]|uniref:copper resistance CopC/CopD family protein n=1 Tax=Mesorhizobium sp. L-8-3 TaxID=2744522 RepID=UPI001928D93A|nr:copper resistance protein CopC [Mesorhizobium sp. L-8-3]BCH25273.1 copper resistance protein C [Mesorhizobium sp. L-8-3]
MADQLNPVVSSLRSAFVAAVLLLALATEAWAHASLNATEPTDGSVLESAPTSYSLTFSEPVSPLALKLIRPDGSATALDRFSLKGNLLEIDAPGDLGRGTHVFSWRVVSEDGHPIGGSVVFSIGGASANAPLIEEHIDWTVRTGLWLSKIGLYVGLFLGVGGFFAVRMLMPGIGRGRTSMAMALAIGTLGAVVSIGFQGLDALGAPAARLAEPTIWSAGFGTSHGRTVLAAIAAFAAVALGLVWRRLQNILATVGLLAGGIALALSGHASAAAPQWLMRPAIFLHASAIAVWIGALIPLGLALRHRDPAAICSLRRFSRFVPYAVCALLAAGIVLAVVQVEQPRAFIETTYGQVFLVKLALMAGLFLLAAVNRWSWTGPAVSGDVAATRRLTRSIAVETLIVLLIFGAAAAWRFTPPPRTLAAAAAEPASIHIHTAKVMADLTITPGRAGPVDVAAVITTGDFGGLDAKEVTFVFANPTAGIEQFKRQAEQSADGTWRAEGVVLPLAGQWTVRIDVLISDFDLARLDGQVNIRR